MNKILRACASLSLLLSANLHAADKDTCLDIGQTVVQRDANRASDETAKAMKNAVTACIAWQEGWRKSNERQALSPLLANVMVDGKPATVPIFLQRLSEVTHFCPHFKGAFAPGATVDSKQCRDNIAMLLPMLKVLKTSSPQPGGVTETKPSAKAPASQPAAASTKLVGREKLYKQVMDRITKIRTLANGKNDTEAVTKVDGVSKIIDKSCIGAAASPSLCDSKLNAASEAIVVLEKRVGAIGAPTPSASAKPSSTVTVPKMPTRPTRR